MSVPDRLREIEHDGLARLAAAATVADLDALREELLGDGSEVAVARRGLRDASPDERKVVGSAVNGVTRAITGAIEDRRAELAATEEQARLETERVDMTLPGRAPALGTHHLVMQVWEEIVDIFVGLGYSVASGPEVETAFYNFDALNTPPTHPARLESDTLYVAHGSDPEGVLLRTQTSPVQARYMEQHDPPVYIVAPGRTYRRDQTDATHTPVFHQMEGLAVDSDITFADLRGTLGYFMDQFFGKHTRQRFLPNFFPFTEPSAEMDVSWHDGWLEWGGCGMIHPRVLLNCGLDPERWQGFAFGMALDRAAMLRFGIENIQLLFDGDLRVLEQL